MTDPDVTRAEDTTRAYYARALAPYLVAGISADDLAAHLVAWSRREGWWPALKPPPDAHRPTDEQAVQRTQRGAQYARELLATTREDHHAR